MYSGQSTGAKTSKILFSTRPLEPKVVYYIHHHILIAQVATSPKLAIEKLTTVERASSVSCFVFFFTSAKNQPIKSILKLGTKLKKNSNKNLCVEIDFVNMYVLYSTKNCPFFWKMQNAVHIITQK